jgi:hypothetical protein
MALRAFLKTYSLTVPTEMFAVAQMHFMTAVWYGTVIREHLPVVLPSVFEEN